MRVQITPLGATYYVGVILTFCSLRSGLHLAASAGSVVLRVRKFAGEVRSLHAARNVTNL
jgi:hypothetical protein